MVRRCVVCRPGKIKYCSRCSMYGQDHVVRMGLIHIYSNNEATICAKCRKKYKLERLNKITKEVKAKEETLRVV